MRRARLPLSIAQRQLQQHEEDTAACLRLVCLLDVKNIQTMEQLFDGALTSQEVVKTNVRSDEESLCPKESQKMSR